MVIKVRDLKVEMRGLIKAGDFGAALAAADHLLAANPLDGESRLGIADLLGRLGDAAGSAAVHRALAMHNVRAGHPLPAIIGCRALEQLGEQTHDIVDQMAWIYAQGSSSLAKFVTRPAPPDEEAEMPYPDLTREEPPAAIIERARQRALDLSAFTDYPSQFLPIPFLSELPQEEFAPVIRALKARRLLDGELAIREGDPGTAFFLVAGGQLRVFVTDSLGHETERTRLFETALFGEMSLLSAEPRSASVQAVGQADLLELDRDGLAALAAELPSLGGMLDKFARERLLKNLLATSPLFKPFDRQQQLDLIRRFEGHEVEPETQVIQEGAPGLGLFVVLAGEVEVTKRPAGGEAEVPLARLRAGEVFGEMSLINNQPTSASVRTVRRSTILFLAREYFQRLIGALPEIRQYFEELSERRGLESQLVLDTDQEPEPEDAGAGATPPPDSDVLS
jgi:CRP-like cAMP-binding protein